MRSVKVRRVLIHDTSVFSVRPSINHYLITFFGNEAKLRPIVLCQRKGKTSERGYDISPVRRCMFLVTPAFSLIDDLQSGVIEVIVVIIGVQIPCLVGDLIIQRRETILVNQRSLSPSTENPAMMRKTWITYSHFFF